MSSPPTTPTTSSRPCATPGSARPTRSPPGSTSSTRAARRRPCTATIDLGFQSEPQAAPVPGPRCTGCRPRSPCRARSRTRTSLEPRPARRCTCRTPTKYLPGYLAWRRPGSAEYFEPATSSCRSARVTRRSSSPALFHAAGANRTVGVQPDGQLAAGVVGVRAAPWRRSTGQDVGGACSRRCGPWRDAGAALAVIANVIAACAEGYAFPTNLDLTSPSTGSRQVTQAEILGQAVRGRLVTAAAGDGARRLVRPPPEPGRGQSQSDTGPAHAQGQLHRSHSSRGPEATSLTLSRTAWCSISGGTRGLGSRHRPGGGPRGRGWSRSPVRRREPGEALVARAHRGREQGAVRAGRRRRRAAGAGLRSTAHDRRVRPRRQPGQRGRADHPRHPARHHAGAVRRAHRGEPARPRSSSCRPWSPTWSPASAPGHDRRTSSSHVGARRPAATSPRTSRPRPGWPG